MPSTEPVLLSIVIPILNEAAGIEAFLAQVRAAFPSAQVLLVDGGSDDDTVGIALQAGVPVLLSEPGRAQQMNLGAAAAQGQWLLFLHADSDIDFGQDALFPLLESAGDGPVWGFFSVQLLGRSALLPIVTWCMNHRSRLTRVATGDQGLFVRRSTFEAIGGYAQIPLMEDIELSKRLRRIAAPLRPAPRIRASGRRWDEQGAMATIVRMWGLRFAFWIGVSPRRLWHHYYGRRALGESRRPVESHV